MSFRCKTFCNLITFLCNLIHSCQTKLEENTIPELWHVFDHSPSKFLCHWSSWMCNFSMIAFCDWLVQKNIYGCIGLNIYMGLDIWVGFAPCCQTHTQWSWNGIHFSDKTLRLTLINSLSPGGCSYFKSIMKLCLGEYHRTSIEKSTSVMARSQQARSHYLGQCWPINIFQCIVYGYMAYMDYIDFTVQKKAVELNHSLTWP